MKTLFKKIINLLKASLPETREHDELESRLYIKKSFPEKIKESFVAVAYAEAADLEDFLRLIKGEREKGEFAYPDECQYGDNELCYKES